MKYILELNEEQAQITQEALEFFARMMNGQWREAVEKCLLEERNASGLHINDFCERRREAESLVMEARGIVYPDIGSYHGASYGIGKFRDSTAAWEIYEVLRYERAWTNHPEGGSTVNFCEPIQISDVPLAKCRAVKDNEKKGG